MDNTKLNSTLLQLAIEKGLCKQWQNEWKPDTDIDGLMDKFLRGIDFYLSNHFLTKEQMLTWFKEEDRVSHNIIIDGKRSILNPPTGLSVGDSVVKIRCNARNICDFYATDNTRLYISVKNNAHLSVTLCDNAVIEDVEIGENARLYVCRAGENTEAIYGDRIRVKDNFNLYSNKNI